MTDQAPDKAGPDLPAERDDETREDEVQSPAEPLQVLKALRHIIELEERRVGVQEDRNRVAMRALEVSDSADQRQHNYHRCSYGQFSGGRVNGQHNPHQ